MYPPVNIGKRTELSSNGHWMMSLRFPRGRADITTYMEIQVTKQKNGKLVRHILFLQY